MTAGSAVHELIREEDRNCLKRSRHAPLRYTVITSLAEGADRIVADVVNGTEDAMTEVLLPMPPADYEQTFSEGSAIDDFRLRLARDPQPVVVGGSPRSGSERHWAYLKAGRQVVDRCDVLIALWNGVERKGAGGTSDVIAYACGEGPALEPTSSGRTARKPVIILRTDKELEVEVRPNGGINLPGLREFERIGRELGSATITDGMVDERMDQLLGKGTGLHPDERYLRNVLKRHLLPLALASERISAACKRMHERRGTWIYTMAAAAVLFVAVGWIFESVRFVAFMSEALLLVAILVMILHAQARGTHGRWLQYRFLAERCRVALRFELLRIRPSMAMPLEGASRHADVSWLVRIFEDVRRTIGRELHGSSAHEGTWPAPARAMVLEKLIDDQVDYHGRRSVLFDRRTRAFRRLLAASFIVALVVALLHLAAEMQGHGPDHGLSGHVLFLASIMLPVLGGALEGVRVQREYERQAAVSRRMVVELGRLRSKLNDTKSEDRFERIAREVDECLMRESTEWLALMIHTDLELKA